MSSGPVVCMVSCFFKIQRKELKATADPDLELELDLLLTPHSCGSRLGVGGP
jgi:hypothetical protein